MDKLSLATKAVFTTGEVAKICHVTVRTVIKWFEAGKLHGYKIPESRDRRIPRDELLRFMKEHGIPIPTDFDGGRKRRVLIAEDERGIVEILTEELSKDRSLEVRSASSGWEAGLALLEFRPHVLVLDYNLGDMDGLAVTKKIRDNPTLQGTRILVMSGYLTDEQGKELLEKGIDDFIRKPFRLEELVAKVDHLLEA
ncbi:MAG: response regulator [Planctomycetes bacterium]|nr:response regulator [Planctomycetota bacterium]MBI3845811.1 response regulator [Planctomycetota bacterium]